MPGRRRRDWATASSRIRERVRPASARASGRSAFRGARVPVARSAPEMRATAPGPTRSRPCSSRQATISTPATRVPKGRPPDPVAGGERVPVAAGSALGALQRGLDDGGLCVAIGRALLGPSTCAGSPAAATWFFGQASPGCARMFMVEWPFAGGKPSQQWRPALGGYRVQRVPRESRSAAAAGWRRDQPVVAARSISATGRSMRMPSPANTRPGVRRAHTGAVGEVAGRETAGSRCGAAASRRRSVPQRFPDTARAAGPAGGRAGRTARCHRVGVQFDDGTAGARAAHRAASRS